MSAPADVWMEGAAAAVMTRVSSVALEEANVTEQRQEQTVAAKQQGMAKGWQVVRGGGQRAAVRQGLREASSGRMVSLPQVWAVAEAQPAPAPTPAPVSAPVLAPEVAFYRKYTEALLGHYANAKLAAGRAPSPMGRDVVRGHATHTRVGGFDDTLHFCIDVERCLATLDRTDAKLLRRIAVQGYSFEEASISMGLSVGGGHHRYNRALDRLTELLLERRILDLGKAVKR